jgi:FkbM family methyltransferase
MDADGPWEPSDTAFVVERLSHGGVFYDIGANVGWYSLNVALRTPASVVCFEPQPERLVKNLTLNSVTSRVFSVALGATNGTVRMTREHKAANYISKAGAIEVSLKTLDSLVREEALDPPTLIKVDVEGFEYEVLKGAVQTLLEHKPLILCEVNGLGESRFGVRDRTLVEFLSDLGYERTESVCSNWVFATGR